MKFGVELVADKEMWYRSMSIGRNHVSFDFEPVKERTVITITIDPNPETPTPEDKIGEEQCDAKS